MSTIAVVLTGGLDSAVMTDILQEQGHQIELIFLETKNNSHELSAAQKVADASDLPLSRLAVGNQTGVLKKPRLLFSFVNALACYSAENNTSTFALSFEKTQKKKYQLAKFLINLVNLTVVPFRKNASGMTLQAPLVTLSKTQIIQEGARLGTPFVLTQSCDTLKSGHCGTCEGCKARKQAFLAAKVSDPTDYMC